MNVRQKLRERINAVPRVDRGLEADITRHLDSLTKPPGSLGQLEEVAARVALIRGEIRPSMKGRAIVTFGADHGVMAEGVSAYPSEVTPQMVRNMLAGGAAINQLARSVDARLIVVDIGVNDPLEGAEGLTRRKIRSGTRNMVVEPAMTEEEAFEAIEVGVEISKKVIDEGATLVGTGEMGIGNTTAAAAVMAMLLPCAPTEVTGRGTGIDDATLRHKIDVIERAIERHRELSSDPFGVLAAVGGLEIAGICGLVLGAASRRVPVVVDGFISSAGALAAIRICEAARDYLIFSHCSAEAGHQRFFETLGERPLLDLGMRLGEGTGAALAMSIVEAAVEVNNGMATFESAGVSGRG